MKQIFYIITLSTLFIIGCTTPESEVEEVLEQGISLFRDEHKLNEACERFLHALSLQDESKPTINLARTYDNISRVYWEQDYTEKALDYALKEKVCCEQLDNDSLYIQMLNRVASCYYLQGPLDSAIYYFTEMKDMALKHGDSVMVSNAINNVASVLLSQKKTNEAIEQFELSRSYSLHRQKDEFKYHYNLSRCYQSIGNWTECADEIRQAMCYCDTTDLEALQKLYRRLYTCEKNMENIDHAFICADSSYILADQSFQQKKREELHSITEKFQQEQYETELRLQQTHWMLAVVNIVFIALIIIVSILYRNKKKTVLLQQRMDAIKVQIARQEEAAADEKEGSSELSQLYSQQFVIARDMFRSRAANNKLRQLKYHTDKEYLADEQRLPIIDSVTEVFIDPMQNLRSVYPELTSDECLYAVLVFLGCNNATISMLTKTTEATLRKRRSRFKQKTSDEVATFLLHPDTYPQIKGNENISK